MKMIRFTSHVLTNSIEDRYTPSEIILRKAFFHEDNVTLIHKTLRSTVDSGASYADVVDLMEKIFRLSIMRDSPFGVDTMNGNVLSEFRRKHEMLMLHTERHTSRAFVGNNIPNTFLPRPSMTIDRHEDDESRGKHTIELFRR